eukprot:5999944-Pyramimonas_sp.AAC.1
MVMVVTRMPMMMLAVTADWRSENGALATVGRHRRPRTRGAGNADGDVDLSRPLRWARVDGI